METDTSDDGDSAKRPTEISTKQNTADRAALRREALINAVKKMDPRDVIHNPVMFVVEIGSVITTALFAVSLFDGGMSGTGPLFTGLVSAWLWFTLLFANYSEALAEGHGKAQADELRRMRSNTSANRIVGEYDIGSELPPDDGCIEVCSSVDLRKGDLFAVRAGEPIPCDGEIVLGVASVDESAITGESAPVIRESGGDRNTVTGGTRVLSDWIVVRSTADPGEGFIDRMIGLIEGSKRKKTPNEQALNTLLEALTVIFLIVCISLIPYSMYAVDSTGQGQVISVTVVISLLVCLAPTTIGGLLSAIGIAGMDRLLQKNVMAMSGQAVEAAGDVDVLLLDKTGTITYGNRRATDIIPAEGVDEQELARVTLLSSIADDTPEGRSIVTFIEEKYGLRADEVSRGEDFEFVPFTAQTRVSGVDMPGESIRKGAKDAIQKMITASGNVIADDVLRSVVGIAETGGTPLVVSRNSEALGVIHLKDVVKPGMKERFAQLRKMGIKTVMITGDNRITAAAIAAEAGVDDYLAEATPENKMAMIRQYQEEGKMVAMTGDGTNDAPALAQADVAVAMNSGTQPAKEAANMIDLDSDPTKLIEIVETGKRLLTTRGALTAFSIANDLAKYFAIIPAAFVGIYPALDGLNFMGLDNAILSAVIFNALIIIALIPLALRGVAYRPMPAEKTFRRNILIYGIGGIIVPFIGIKLIDMAVSVFGVIA